MKKILVIGEILVEVMADTPGTGFLQPQPLTGPFPSGAPAIFADQAAKLGQPVAIVSAVGDDDFGRMNLARLQQDGVDVSGVVVDAERPTGTAFVRYDAAGARQFIFNLRHSACGRVHVTEAVDRLLNSAGHLHVMGSSLSDPASVQLNLRAAEAIRARGGTVSFDPNVRAEMLRAPGMTQAMHDVLARTDLFLPSGEELTLVAGGSTPEDAIDGLIARGVGAVVHKNGAAGATYIGGSSRHQRPAFAVQEVDPTGAGDCFSATFTALWLRGVPAPEALELAVASGAMAVLRRGPMEGTATLDELQAFLRTARPSA